MARAINVVLITFNPSFTIKLSRKWQHLSELKMLKWPEMKLQQLGTPI